jgi:type I restriction enzyme S subunit
MSKWPSVPLQKVASPIERPEVPNPGKAYRQVGVKLWGEGAYERETIDGGATKYKTLSRVETNDIIVNKIWARNGSVAVVPRSLEGGYVSGEFPTFTPISEKLEPRWFHWLTKTPSFWDQCDEKSRGTSGKNRIKPERFLEIEIPLPPLPEQQRIVARIESLSAKIEEARGLRQQTCVEVAALVTSIHAKLSGKRTKKLGEILKLDEDQVSVSAIEQYPQVGIKSFGGGLFAKSAVAGTQTTYKSFNRLYEGALILSQVKAWEGAIAVCERSLAGWFVSPEYRTFRCISGEALPGYLSMLVRTEWFWSKLSHATRGVGARRERTRPEQLLAIELPMPTVKQQEEGAMLFGKLDALKPLQSETRAELAALLPSILDKAFKGGL